MFRNMIGRPDIHEYVIPKVVEEKTRIELNLTSDEFKLLKLSFFDFFYLVKELKNVEMTNKKVDVLWHNLILHTKEYKKFCDDYVGFFVHHEPHTEEKKVSNNKIEECSDRLKKIIDKNESYRKYRSNYYSNYYKDRPIDYSFIMYYALAPSSDCSSSSDRGSSFNSSNDDGYRTHDGSSSNNSSSYDSGCRSSSSDSSSSCSSSSGSSCSSSSGSSCSS